MGILVSTFKVTAFKTGEYRYKDWNRKMMLVSVSQWSGRSGGTSLRENR